MNCLLLMVATSLPAWGDPAPVATVEAPPASDCTTCAAPSGDASKPNCFERLKASLARTNCDWGCMPCVVGHPAPQYHYQPACTCPNNCNPGCLEKLKARFTKADCGTCPGASESEEGLPPGSLIGNRYQPTPAMMPYLLPTMTSNQRSGLLGHGHRAEKAPETPADAIPVPATSTARADENAPE